MFTKVSCFIYHPIDISWPIHSLEDEPLTERTVMSQWLGADLWQQENQCYSAARKEHEFPMAEMWNI